MCGRYALYGPVSRKNRAAIEFLGRELEFNAVYNAAPTQDLPVFRVGPRGRREFGLMRWGLIPYWAKNVHAGAKLINIRADTISEKPVFHAVFSRRRCLVPMSGFYEWRKGGGRKVPYFVHPLNAPVFAAAGLYEYWPGKEGDTPIESFTIITTEANALVRTLHDRMPVLLHEADYEAWLDPDNRDVRTLKDLLKPFPAEEMRAYPVGPRVNNAKNEGADLIEFQEDTRVRELDF
jgi:putative SOS response-associated peptidase YedK